MDELNATIELQESRSGKIVPVIDGIYLHSIYNPEKEAEAFAANYERAVADKSHVLILGLGFGYHVEKIAALAKTFHESPKVLVYEPNLELINAFNERGGFQDAGVEIVHAQDPVEVFRREDFIMFLTAKPAIIKHETSYNLNQSFYKEFLTYKAPIKMRDYQDLLTPRAKEMFPGGEGGVDQVLEAIKTAGKVNAPKDRAFLALEAIINSAKRASKR